MLLQVDSLIAQCGRDVHQACIIASANQQISLNNPFCTPSDAPPTGQRLLNSNVNLGRSVTVVSEVGPGCLRLLVANRAVGHFLESLLDV